MIVETELEKNFLDSLKAMVMAQGASLLQTDTPKSPDQSYAFALARALHEATREPGMRPWISLNRVEQENKERCVLVFLGMWKKCGG